MAEIYIVCFNRLETIEAKMMCQKEVTETLKAANQMEWARRRNSLQSQTGKIVLQELMSVK
ncbi:MAG TPA: TnpV protein [Candidatus Fimiplasma intestinipullorum]|uniref:TnpV protein n=1 Tax=Candidatus Fimiplasma intestinipullorum TaxID=2840825 RepID=A0A9D1HP45_9FIRM|nr:TnpV protein [Candidatus Fimiplasma intestinipullorum]